MVTKKHFLACILSLGLLTPVTTSAWPSFCRLIGHNISRLIHSKAVKFTFLTAVTTGCLGYLAKKVFGHLRTYKAMQTELARLKSAREEAQAAHAASVAEIAQLKQDREQAVNADPRFKELQAQQKELSADLQATREELERNRATYVQALQAAESARATVLEQRQAEFAERIKQAVATTAAEFEQRSKQAVTRATAGYERTIKSLREQLAAVRATKEEAIAPQAI